MNKKSNKQSGITLIALVITIIVMLILVAVTISMAVNGGLFNYAGKATGETQNAINAEQELADGRIKVEGTWYNSIDEYLAAQGEGWKQEGATLTKTTSDGTKIQVKIGDYVDYNEGSYTHTPVVEKGAGTSVTGGSETEGWNLESKELTTEDLEWRVLGVSEKGELELISATPTTQELCLANAEGYINAEENLKNFCNDLYGKGEYATGARSLKVEDINKLTNYDPTKQTRYGEKRVYRFPTQEEMDAYTGTSNSKRYMQYSVDSGKTWKNITFNNYQTLRLLGEPSAISESNPGKSNEIVNLNAYTYEPFESNFQAGGKFTEDEAEMLFLMITGGNGNYDFVYYLGNRFVEVDDRVMYGIMIVYHIYEGVVGAGNQGIYRSNMEFGSDSTHVRPVVSLKSDVELIKNTSTNVWELK